MGHRAAPPAAPASGGADRRPERLVLVTVGTTKFDALVRAVDSEAVADALSAAGYTALVIQAGAGLYRPHRLFPPNARAARLRSGLRVEWFDFAPSLAAHMAAAELVVTHSGAGSLFEALGAGKAVVAVPNADLMDDHQRELAAKLAAGRHLVTASPDTLLEALRGLDPGALAPYRPGDPGGIVARVDALCGVRGGGGGGGGGRRAA
jgi:beta-1,4-N-acetylglucosaminyltransferase